MGWEGEAMTCSKERKPQKYMVNVVLLVYLLVLTSFNSFILGMNHPGTAYLCKKHVPIDVLLKWALKALWNPPFRYLS